MGYTAALSIKIDLSGLIREMGSEVLQTITQHILYQYIISLNRYFTTSYS